MEDKSMESQTQLSGLSANTRKKYSYRMRLCVRYTSMAGSRLATLNQAHPVNSGNSGGGYVLVKHHGPDRKQKVLQVSGFQMSTDYQTSFYSLHERYDADFHCYYICAYVFAFTDVNSWITNAFSYDSHAALKSLKSPNTCETYW